MRRFYYGSVGFFLDRYVMTFSDFEGEFQIIQRIDAVDEFFEDFFFLEEFYGDFGERCVKIFFWFGCLFKFLYLRMKKKLSCLVKLGQLYCEEIKEYYFFKCGLFFDCLYIFESKCIIFLGKQFQFFRLRIFFFIGVFFIFFLVVFDIVDIFVTLVVYEVGFLGLVSVVFNYQRQVGVRDSIRGDRQQLVCQIKVGRKWSLVVYRSIYW